jgi:hypothetical protein
MNLKSGRSSEGKEFHSAPLERVIDSASRNHVMTRLFVLDLQLLSSLNYKPALTDYLVLIACHTP